MKNVFVMLMVCLFVCLAGCRKKFMVEKYAEVENNETAFVIPLEDNVGKQVQLQDDYEKYLVTAKRIPISQRWKATGRMAGDGEWIETVKVIKVSRSPVTKEWTADSFSGTSNKNEGIWIESKDSVGFSTGFTCTAYIKDNEAAIKFLRFYPSTNLSVVMNEEICGRIQSVSATVASQYVMDILRERKNEIIVDVRNDVIPFFENRGITITTIGMFGGFTYENPKIQESIDNVFVAQQEKNVALAMKDAQKDKNSRLLEEADAIAAKTIKIANAEASAAKSKADGEAAAILAVAEAAAKANSNPAFLALKQLEVETKRIEKWSGQYPAWYMTGSDEKMNLMISPPTMK